MKDIIKEIQEKKVVLEEYYQKMFSNNLKQTHLIKDTKKAIARLFTRLHGKQTKE